MKFLLHKQDVDAAARLLELPRGKRSLEPGDEDFLLSMIGSAALSGASGVAIDPTVKAADASRIIDLGGQMGMTISHLAIGSHARNPEDLEGLDFVCESAARQFLKSGCFAEALATATSPDRYTGQVFSEGHAEAFGGELTHLAKLAGGEALAEKGCQLLENEGLYGNKFLAGLALHDSRELAQEIPRAPADVTLATEVGSVFETWSSLPLSRQQILMTELISGFRKFLLFNLSEAADAAYPCNDAAFLRKLDHLHTLPAALALDGLLKPKTETPEGDDDGHRRLVFAETGLFVLDQAVEAGTHFDRVLRFAHHFGKREKLEALVDQAFGYLVEQPFDSYQETLDRLKSHSRRRFSIKRLFAKGALELGTGGSTLMIPTDTIKEEIEEGFSIEIEKIQTRISDFAARSRIGRLIRRTIADRKYEFAKTLRTLRPYAEIDGDFATERSKLFRELAES